MTITIDLPEDVGSELLADARAQDADPAALIAILVANVYGVAGVRGTTNAAEEDPDAVREIGEAIAEFETSYAAGERGLSVDDAFARIEEGLAARRLARAA